MILVDTSVWVMHLRKGNTHLENLLQDVEVACHPMIIGELACGSLHNRNEILALLRTLSQAVIAEHSEVLQFIEKKRLMGCGIGYIDAHLLASATLSDMLLWTEDNRLKETAEKLKIAYKNS